MKFNSICYIWKRTSAKPLALGCFNWHYIIEGFLPSKNRAHFTKIVFYSFKQMMQDGTVTKFNKVSLFQINQTLKSRHNPRMSDVKVFYLRSLRFY